MTFTIEAIIFYLVLIDAIGANIISFCCAKWYNKKYKRFSKMFPANKYFTVWYLILVIWIGCNLSRLGII